MTQDYTAEIKSFIDSKFIPATETSKEPKQLTLVQIYELVISVFPEQWITQSDVFSVLQELGYVPAIMEIDDNTCISGYLMNVK